MTLWATNTVTLQMVIDAKNTKRTRTSTAIVKGNRSVPLPKYFIRNNGVEESTGFNEATWSAATTKYMSFVNNRLRGSSFDKIIDKAMALVPVVHTGGSDDVMDVDPDDIQLVDLSDDDECKLTL